jgi:hypothetical protein
MKSFGYYRHKEGINYLPKLQQGQKIEFKITDNLCGTGKIIGIATSGQPVIGITYIIEPDIDISNTEYPYTHFACSEIFIKPIE